MRVISTSIFLALIFLSSCTKEMLNADDSAINTSLSQSGSNQLRSEKDYFTSFGGKWELIWVNEGHPGLEREYSLPFEEIREESLGEIPCGNGPYIDTTIIYVDTYKNHRFTFTTDDQMSERLTTTDLDPIPALSNCHNIHFKHTEYLIQNDGNWSFNAQTNAMTWLITTGNDDLYTFFGKYEGRFEPINDNEFWFTGILSMYAEENGIPGGITTLPFKYRIKRFSEKK